MMAFNMAPLKLVQLKKVGLLTSLLLLSGHSFAWDEDREVYFSSRFEQAMKDKDYCKAMQIADQRLLDPNNPKQRMARSQMDSRHLRWVQSFNDTDARCNQAGWGVAAKQYEAEINTLNQELATLKQLQQQFRVLLLADGIDLNPITGKGSVTLGIKNKSQYAVSGFVLDYSKVNRYIALPEFRYPADMRLAGIKQTQGLTFEAGTEQVIKIQSDYAPQLDGLMGDNLNIPLKQITVIDGATSQVYDFGRIDTIGSRIFKLRQALENRRYVTE